jgi:hypothetical protein
MAFVCSRMFYFFVAVFLFSFRILNRLFKMAHHQANRKYNRYIVDSDPVRFFG